MEVGDHWTHPGPSIRLGWAEGVLVSVLCDCWFGLRLFLVGGGLQCWPRQGPVGVASIKHHWFFPVGNCGLFQVREPWDFAW